MLIIRNYFMQIIWVEFNYFPPSTSVDICLCQKSLGRKFKKVKLTSVTFFALLRTKCTNRQFISKTRAFQEMLSRVEFFAFFMQVHTIPLNIFLMQNKTSIISFPSKIKNTFKENKNFISKISIFFPQL